MICGQPIKRQCIHHESVGIPNIKQRQNVTIRARLHQASVSILLQHCNDTSYSVSLKSIESLENRLQPHSGTTLLFSMRTKSHASSQSCCSVDANVPLASICWCLQKSWHPRDFISINASLAE